MGEYDFEKWSYRSFGLSPMHLEVGVSQWVPFHWERKLIEATRKKKGVDALTPPSQALPEGWVP